MALLSADSFNRANSTSSLGATDGAGSLDPLTWAQGAGFLGINSNQMYCSSIFSGGRALGYVDLATGDVDLSFTAATFNDGASLMFRYTDNSNFWVWAYYGQLWKNVGGTFSAVGSTHAGGANGDTIRVTTSGTTIKCYRNGTLLETIADSFNATATKHGHYTESTTARFDSWSAYSPGTRPLSTDTFNRTNSTSTLGSTDGAGTLDPLAWTASSGTWGINSNQAYCPTLSGGIGIAQVELGTADVDVSVTVPTFASCSPSLLFRYTNNSNYLIWYYHGAGNIRLYKNVGGSFTPLGTDHGGTADGDVLRVVANGTTITCYRNGVQLESLTESFNSTATKHGMWAEQTTGRFDTWSASSPGAASQTVNANLLTVTATISNPSVLLMRQMVNTNLLSASPTFFSPTVSAGTGTQTVAMNLLTATASFDAPSVGQPTVVVPATPPQYVLKVVDIYGANPLTLASAIPDEITWTLNEPAEASFSFPKPAYTEAQLPTLATASDVREIQIFRDGDLLFWGPMIQPGAAGSRGDVQCHCADPLWVLDRRNIDAPRVNLVDNPSFEDGFTGWINNGGVTATASTARKILGTHSARLESSTAGGDTHLRSHFSVFPTPRGVILTVVGWFWLESITAPAFASIGLMLEGGQSHTVERNNYYAIDTATPTGRWTRAEFELVTQPRETWDCTLKIFCPQGVIFWDALAVVANDGTGTNEEEWDIARTAGFLVNHVQSTTFGKSHYNVGTNTANNGVTLQRNYLYSVHTSFSDALAEFADRNDGFDYSCKITPTTRQFTTHTPKKGTDRSGSVTLTFGGNVADYRWSRDGGGAITRATETSDSGEGGVRAREEGEYVDASQLGGLILQEVRSAPPEVELNSLLPLATERVNKRGTPPLVLELDILPSAGLIHTLAVGDTVTVHINDGYVQVSGARRIVRQTLHCRTNVLTVFVNEETD